MSQLDFFATGFSVGMGVWLSGYLAFKGWELFKRLFSF